jgi:hypothetical protein
VCLLKAQRHNTTTKNPPQKKRTQRNTPLQLAGHYHPGGAAVGPTGVHYVTLEGLVEAPEGSNAYALVDVFNDRIRVRGYGAATSRELALRGSAGAAATADAPTACCEGVAPKAQQPPPPPPRPTLVDAPTRHQR